MNRKKYYTTIADLLSDDGFLAWYLKRNDNCAAVQAWNRWINENSMHAQIAKKAVKLLSLMLRPDEDPIPQEQISASFERLHRKIIIQEENISAYTNKK